MVQLHEVGRTRKEIVKPLIQIKQNDPVPVGNLQQPSELVHVPTETIPHGPIMDDQDAMRVPSFFDDVVAFHVKFGIQYDGPPRFPLEESLAKFRRERLVSEMREHIDAVNAGQAEGAFDGLIDLIYIALGTCHQHGWDANEGWKRVHQANMAKIRVDSAEKSPWKYACDIVKPDGWTPPDLSDLVQAKVTEVKTL